MALWSLIGEHVVTAIRRYAAEPEARRGIGGEEEHGQLLRSLGETNQPADVAGLPAP